MLAPNEFFKLEILVYMCRSSKQSNFLFYLVKSSFFLHLLAFWEVDHKEEEEEEGEEEEEEEEEGEE